MEPVSRRLEQAYEKVQRSRKNCSFATLESLLLAAGFQKRPGKGSHFVFKRGSKTITVPFARPVKEHYVKEVLSLLEAEK
jgi:predicted RNA binding protein YcfA (HicA-like mRNA interferase family)